MPKRTRKVSDPTTVVFNSILGPIICASMVVGAVVASCTGLLLWKVFG